MTKSKSKASKAKPIKESSNWKQAIESPETVEELTIKATHLPRVKGGGLKSLPAEIGRFVNLRELWIRGENLGALCLELGTLEKLEKLDIDNTPEALKGADVLGNLKGLKRLSLYNVGLTRFVPMPPSLEELKLEADREIDLESWLDGLEALPNLRSLYLNECYRYVPQRIVRLPALRLLWLTKNDYGEIPPAVFSLSELEGLGVGQNPLPSLPARLGSLTRLKRLVAYSCKLESLPPELQKLTELEHLDVSNNPLRELPAWIGSFKRLKSLDLSQIRFADLPPELLELPLESLTLDVPAEVAEEARRRLPRCKVKLYSAADNQRDVDKWLRFLGK